VVANSAVLPLPWRALRHKVSRGVTAPLFSLDHWWEVLFLHQRVEPRCRINLKFIGSANQILLDPYRYRYLRSMPNLITESPFT
jgi:hypothetical protein